MTIPTLSPPETPPAAEPVPLAPPAAAAAPGVGVERVLGRVRGAAAGPTLICVAGLHGNEPSGVAALRRVLARLAPPPGATEGGAPGSGGPAADGPAGELSGELLALSGNRRALGRRVRFLREDLNRMWSEERVARLRAAAGPLADEDEELIELDREIAAAFAAARGPVYVLDLHSTSGRGPAFAVVDDTLANRDFALRFGVPLVLGLEEELDGPLLHFLLDRGAVTLGFEGGQHDEPAAVDRAEAAVWIALEAAGLLPPGRRPEPAAARALLAAASAGLPRVVEVRYRHAIDPDQHFRMEPGFASFEAVAAGQVIAYDRGGPVAVRESGRLLMPLYQPLGDDGYFLIRAIRPVWLAVSRRMRRLGLERFLHWLPGVRRHPELRRAFIVDRRVARWYALEIFHLLGFRRHGRAGAQVVISRRANER